MSFTPGPAKASQHSPTEAHSAIDSGMSSPAPGVPSSGRTPREKTGIFGFSEAVLIAGVPFLGYSIAFAYETGLIGRYGLPLWITRPDISHVLFATGFLGTLFVALIQLARVLPNRPWMALFVVSFLPAVFAIPLYALLRLTEWVPGRHLEVPIGVVAVFTIVIVVALWFDVIKPVITRENGTWWDSWRVRAEVITGRLNASLLDSYLRDSPTRVRLFQLAALLYVCISVGWYVGDSNSRRQREFALSSSSPPCVALERYGDGIVCVLVDTLHRQALQAFRLIPFSDPKETFQMVSLGPLRTLRDAAESRKRFAPPASVPADTPEARRPTQPSAARPLSGPSARATP